MAEKKIYCGSGIQNRTIELNSETIIKEIGQNKKIINAVLQLSSATIGSEEEVKAICHGSDAETIDFLLPRQNGTAIINVTHEINCVLQNEKQGISFQFKNADTKCGGIYLLVEYIPKQIMHENNSYVDVAVKKAGSGKINLSTGNLRFESAGLVYNGWQANKEQVEVDDAADGAVRFDTHCGKGWKLGVQQHLVKRKSADGEEVYTYIDGDGNYHEFTEKYYYVESDKKIYVPKKDVVVDLEGNLTYLEQKVKTERRSTNGLMLETDYGGFQYGHLLEMRQDEQIQLEENVDSYERQLKTYVAVQKTDGKHIAALQEYAASGPITQEIFDKFLHVAANGLVLSASEAIQYRSLLLQQTQAAAQGKLAGIGKTVNLESNSYARALGLSTSSLVNLKTMLTSLRASLIELTRKENAADPQGKIKFNYQYAEFIKYLRENKYFHTDECKIKDLVSVAATQKNTGMTNLPVVKCDHLTDGLCDLQAELECLNDDLDALYCAQTYGYNMEQAEQDDEIYIKSTFNSVLTDNLRKTKSAQIAIQQSIRAFQKNFNGKVDHIQQEITDLDKIINDYLNEEQGKLVNEQIELLVAQSDAKKSDLQKYYKQYVNYKYQLQRMNEQLPTHFIVGGETTLGFNKFGCLSMLFDEYENQAAIIYDNGKIVSVKDTDNNETSFEYNSNGLLCKIIDKDENITSFNYDNERNLTSVVVGDKKIATFDYCYRDHNNKNGLCNNGELKRVTDNNGYYVEFVYDDSCQIVQVKEFSDVFSVSNDKVLHNSNAQSRNIACIQYHQSLQAATVTNSNGVKTTYIFDQLGKPVTVYEGEFNKGKKTKAVSLEYVDGKQSFAIEEKTKLGNLIDNATVTNTLSDGDQSSRRVCKIGIDKSALKDGVTDYVFSAWVKANSAFIKNARKLDGSFGAIMGDVEQYFDTDQANRKFELRAEVNYATGEPDVYSASFDWLNTDWQYLTLPVEIANTDQDGDKLPCKFPIKIGSPKREVVDIDLYVDYSFNVGTIELGDMSFREGVWKYSTFDEKGRKLTDEDSAGKSKTTYYYDDNDRVVKSVVTDKLGRKFIATFEYNKQGRTVRTTNYAGVVEETLFDDKGRETKKIRYNLDDPTSKLYTESKRNDKGVVTADVDESGEYDAATYTYGSNGETSVQTDGKGNKTSFGCKNGNLVSLSGSADGEESTNTMKYTADLLTKSSNGDTDYNFTYDGWDRTTKVEINGTTYADVAYEGSFRTIETLASGDTVTTETDDHGNILQQSTKFANGEVETVTNAYDDLHTLRTKTIDIDQKRCYNINYEYDNVLDKVTKETIVKDGVNTFSKSHSYTTDGDLERTEYQIGAATLSYGFETDGTPDKRDSKVCLPFGVQQNVLYDGLGRTKEISLGNNLVKDVYYAKYGDHATNRVSSVWYGVNGIRKESTRYTYDKAGNIDAVIVNGKLVARYAYDGLNRLVREDNIHFGTFTYCYDHAGNILSKTARPFTLGKTLADEGTACQYQYAQCGWKDQLLSFDDQRCEYDPIGNPAKYRDRTLSWQGRRLLSYGKDGRSARFTYDFNGVRTGKTVKNGEQVVSQTEYVYDGNSLVAEKRNNAWLYFFYGVDGIAGFRQKDVTYLFRKNIQGDVTHIYTTGGDLVAQYVYDAWGNCKILVDIDGIATANPFRYRGYYYDPETGLYYLQTRYYDPETGRFISADGIQYLDPETLGGLNLYAYCNSNPIMSVDPDGTLPDWLAWLFTALIFVGFAVATVVTGGAALAVGGLIGATIGLGGSVISQGITNGWDNIDPWQVLFDTGMGAVSGMFGASGINAVESAICGATLGFVGSVGSDVIAGREVDFTRAIEMAAVGGFIGGWTKAGATNSKELGKLFTKGIVTNGKGSFAYAIGKLLSLNTAKMTIGGFMSRIAIPKIAQSIAKVSVGIAVSMGIGLFIDLRRKLK